MEAVAVQVSGVPAGAWRLAREERNWTSETPLTGGEELRVQIVGYESAGRGEGGRLWGHLL